VQDALNKTCKALFLSEELRARFLRIALDDDKVHYHFSSAMLRRDGNFLLGMKPCQHVKANCRGFTIDSAVFSATGFPIHFSVLKGNENNSDNYDRMVRYMFKHRFQRGLLNQALKGVTFCSDRGYWAAGLISDLLCYGATVFGTLRRSPVFPYTYEQKNLYKRECIDGKKGRSIFTAFTRWNLDMLKVMAWRSGTAVLFLWP
jgi:hypothetical protein